MVDLCKAVKRDISENRIQKTMKREKNCLNIVMDLMIVKAAFLSLLSTSRTRVILKVLR